MVKVEVLPSALLNTPISAVLPGTQSFGGVGATSLLGSGAGLLPLGPGATAPLLAGAGLSPFGAAGETTCAAPPLSVFAPLP